MPQQLVYSVAQLNRAVQQSIVRSIGSQGLVLVKGEIGGLRITQLGPGRAMAFFNLHEGDESLSCVSYGRALDKMLTCDSQTGEVFSPPRRITDVLVNERKVLCEGLLGTYTKKGQSLYQLSVYSVTDCGAGDRTRQLKELTAKLARLGYFKEERKRPLPLDPECVALVTSETGAVIHDFLRNAQDRGHGARMRLYPVRVQGETAGREMARAIAAAGQDPANQVVVLIRGGGSEEDLACFNDEELVRAIFSCPVPVLAGIGHETDFTLADMTADVRASTPTKAAQILWTPRAEVRGEIELLQGRARRSLDMKLLAAEQALGQTQKMLRAYSPQNRWLTLFRQTEDLAARLQVAGTRLCQAAAQQVDNLAGRAASALSGKEELARQRLDQLQDMLSRTGPGFVAFKTQQWRNLEATVQRAGADFLAAKEQELETVGLQLAAVSPLAPLERGFALVQDAQGHVVRSIAEVQPGQSVQMLVLDGQISATVTETKRQDLAPNGRGQA